jgi:hypothetical protein
MDWESIDSYYRNVVGTKEQHLHILCANDKSRWIRFGKLYPGLNRWYYSGTTEKSQYAQYDDGDRPTHWMPMFKGPW